jgi:hypothetical protein
MAHCRANIQSSNTMCLVGHGVEEPLLVRASRAEVSEQTADQGLLPDACLPAHANTLPSAGLPSTTSTPRCRRTRRAHLPARRLERRDEGVARKPPAASAWRPHYG